MDDFEYDERVKSFWRRSHGNYIVKTIDDAELQDKVKKLNTLPLHSGAFIFSNSKRNMINILHAINGFIQMMFFTETPIQNI